MVPAHWKRQMKTSNNINCNEYGTELFIDEKCINEYHHKIKIQGYTLIKNVYSSNDIKKISSKFDDHFTKRLQRNKVQSRDYRRFACKLPLTPDYQAILNNPFIHRLMSKILGEEYVLSHFNSHSSLPGSSRQSIHVDSTDRLNSATYVNGQTNVVFLHIPLLNTHATHGATAIWPAIAFTEGLLDTKKKQWIANNLAQSENQLNLGDVIIKRDNCFHAGGKNTSQITRHMLTLIFVRKYIYLHNNSGMLPGRIYDQSHLTTLPYNLASHCHQPPQDLTVTYQSKHHIKPLYSTINTQQQIALQQFERIKQGFPLSLLEGIKASPHIYLNDPNAVFHTVSYILPLVKAAFGDNQFTFHSITLNSHKRLLDCDDPLFKQYQNQSIFNNDNNLIKIHIPLDSTTNSFITYPGNKLLSLAILKDPSLFDTSQTQLSINEGDILITTGALMYAKSCDQDFVEITFVRPHFIPSYDDRFWISDTFALSLPNKLSQLIRYSNILITQNQYLDFTYSLTTHIEYIIWNYVINLSLKHKVIGAPFVFIAACFIFPSRWIKNTFGHGIKQLLKRT